MEFEEIIEKFPGGKLKGNKYQSICPAHNDKKASLSISDSEKKVLVYCHAGCKTEDVLGCVGLKIEDLYKNYGRTTDKLSSLNNKYDVMKTLLNLDLKEKGKVTEVYKYTDVDGNILFYKLRTDKKYFSFIRLLDSKIIWGLGKGKYYETYHDSNQYSLNVKNTSAIELESQEKVLYNLKNFMHAKREGYPIFIVEGEKDVETMKKIGLVAVSSCTGAGIGNDKWPKEFSELFKGCDVIILPDNDEPGKEFSKFIKKSLLNYCFRIREYIISEDEKGDVSDWYNSLNEIEKMDAKKKILEKIRFLEPKMPKWYKITPKIQKVGDNEIIVEYEYTLRKNYFAKHIAAHTNMLFIGDDVTSRPNIFIYSDGIYEHRLDILSEIEKYLYIDDVKMSTLNEVHELIIKTGEVPIHKSDILNGNEEFINFQNGIYNIKTKKLLKHTPDYINSVKLQCNYNPNAINKGFWDKYIYDLSEGKEDHKKILQEMAGLVISNIAGYRVKKVLALWGKGDTGKSKFWDILAGIIGDKSVGVIELQQLAGSENKFNMVALHGKTFVYDGDLTKEGITDPSKLKKITGGDTLKGEYKNKNIIHFKFFGIYAFACNDLPIIMGDHGKHMYERLQILPCNNVIPIEKRDKYLVENILKNEKEYIINWALEGLDRLINNNLEFSYCNDIELVRKEYKKMSDSVFAFIDEKYEITGEKKDRVAVSILKTEYENYCIKEGIKKPVEKTSEFKERCKNIEGLTVGKVSIDCVKGLKKIVSNKDTNIINII